MQRGEKEIRAAAVEMQKAANRNADKGDWRVESLAKHWEKLREEQIEFYEAMLEGDKERILEELGDFLWSAVIIGSHGYQLGGLEPISTAEAGERLASVANKAREYQAKKIQIGNPPHPFAMLPARLAAQMNAAIDSTLKRLARPEPPAVSEREAVTADELRAQRFEVELDDVTRNLRDELDFAREQYSELAGEYRELENDLEAAHNEAGKLQRQIVEDAAVYQEQIAELQAAGGPESQELKSTRRDLEAATELIKSLMDERAQLYARLKVQADEDPPQEPEMLSHGRYWVSENDEPARLHELADDGQLKPIHNSPPAKSADELHEEHVADATRQIVEELGEDPTPMFVDSGKPPIFGPGDAVRLLEGDNPPARVIVFHRRVNGEDRRYSVELQDGEMREVEERFLERGATAHRSGG